jgi:hypothetical protein
MPALSDLNRLLGRELATLRDELLAYPDDASVWALPAGVPNSAGTLTLHLAGNLRFYVGAQLGATGYVRDRETEFAQRNVPRDELVQLVERAADEVTRTLANLDPAVLSSVYPVEVGGLRLETLRFLLHLEAHFAYHLGQIDYHRRVVTGHSRSVGALPLPALADH